MGGSYLLSHELIYNTMFETKVNKRGEVIGKFLFHDWLAPVITAQTKSFIDKAVLYPHPSINKRFFAEVECQSVPIDGYNRIQKYMFIELKLTYAYKTWCRFVVAQMFETPASHARGRGFKTYHLPLVPV